MASPGPAQSDELIHFTSRGETARFTTGVPAAIQGMTCRRRLNPDPVWAVEF